MDFNNSTYAFRRKIILFFCGPLIPLTIILGFWNVYIGQHLLGGAYISVGLVWCFIFYLTYKGGNLFLPSLIMLIFNMIAISLVWIYTKGINGTMPMAFLPSLIVCILTFEPKHSKHIIITHLLVLLILAFFGSKFHELTSDYDTVSLEYYDKVSYAFVTVLAIGIMIMILYKKYDDERIQLKETNDALTKSKEELNEVNERLEELTYITSHDLKTPIRGIHHYSEFLKEDFGKEIPDEGIEMIDGIKKLANRMDLLVNEVLSFSKAQKADLEFQTFELADAIKEVVKDIDCQPDINIDISYTEMPTVKADYIGMKESIMNFVTNAFKYNDSENKTIDFIFKKDSKELLIKDNGIGIDGKNHEKVFAFFKRIHARDEYGGGTGAGLAIVKKILQRQGISIKIESELGKGSTFILDLKKVLV